MLRPSLPRLGFELRGLANTPDQPTHRPREISETNHQPNVLSPPSLVVHWARTLVLPLLQPSHLRGFTATCEVIYAGCPVVGRASASTKETAEKAAALEVLRRLPSAFAVSVGVRLASPQPQPPPAALMPPPCGIRGGAAGDDRSAGRADDEDGTSWPRSHGGSDTSSREGFEDRKAALPECARKDWPSSTQSNSTREAQPPPPSPLRQPPRPPPSLQQPLPPVRVPVLTMQQLTAEGAAALAEMASAKNRLLELGQRPQATMVTAIEFGDATCEGVCCGEQD